MKYFVLLALLLALCGCTAPTNTPTPTIATITYAVEDTIAVALPRILARNPGYREDVVAVGAGLLVLRGTKDVTESQVQALISRTKLSAADKQELSALIVDVYTVYSMRYHKLMPGLLPDVAIWVDAVSVGIARGLR